VGTATHCFVVGLHIMEANVPEYGFWRFSNRTSPLQEFRKTRFWIPGSSVRKEKQGSMSRGTDLAARSTKLKPKDPTFPSSKLKMSMPPSGISCVLQKSRCMAWGSRFRLWGSSMRPSQALDTHLNRQTDLAGTRERISTRGPFGRSPTALALLLGRSIAVDIDLLNGGSRWRSEGLRARYGEKKTRQRGGGGGLPGAGDARDRRRRRRRRGRTEEAKSGEELGNFCFFFFLDNVVSVLGVTVRC
jgi:hypothetical protein